ncbi:MAG TPA: hemolysin family protein [bacterium]|nr:hemolysin family protein [bacterium]
MGIVEIAIFLGLLGLSAFFNCAEQAIFGLNGNDIGQLKESRDRASKRVVTLLKHPRHLLISIITGNVLTIIAFGVVGASVAFDLASLTGWNPLLAILGEVILLSLLLIIVGHITPRILALGNTVDISRAVSLPIAVLCRLFYPLAFVVFRTTKFLSRLVGVTKENLFISEEEIRTLVEVSEIQGALQEEEKDMIYSIFEFGETAVREIMIPRIDMVAVPSTMRVNEVIDVIKKHRFSRMPLYEKRVDNITGILYAKDLLPYLDKQATNVESAMLGRPAYFVPEKMKIDKLMREFQQRKTNIAVVVDEYGGTSGLVTLEDIIEEIVGEIRDEYDFEAPMYRWIDARTLLVNARINLDDLEQVVVLGIEEERDYDTLAGFLYTKVGEIPEEKTEMIYNDVKYIIDRVQGNRINRVRIALPPERIEQDEAEEEGES